MNMRHSNVSITVHAGRTERSGDAGSALIGSVIVMLVLSTLATVSLNIAFHEIQASHASREELSAQNIAQSAIELALAWFHDPRVTPEGPIRAFFSRAYQDGDTAPPSFFDQNGKSQFRGTAEVPDVLFDSARPDDEQLLNDPQHGWFRSLAPLGRLLKLKVYGPARPGLLCTVEAVARSGGVSRTVSVELGARSIPPVREGARLGLRSFTGLPPPDAPVPVWVHWGDITAYGDVHLGRRVQLPMKTDLAPTGEESYAEMVPPEDRWLDFWLGGNALLDGQLAEPITLPAHVHPNREPSPGLEQNHWRYEDMKRQALLYGAYYVPDTAGLLRLNGMLDAQAMTPTEVFTSSGVGDHRGVVFIDTLDQRPPNPDNMATLSVESEYSEGLFIVNGHLHWKPRGQGKPVPALSPPPEDTSSLIRRIPAQLSGIHLQGVLWVSGNLVYEGSPRLYGAVMIDGVITNTLGSRLLEVWYNHDLRAGLLRGMPLVYIVSNTWRERY